MLGCPPLWSPYLTSILTYPLGPGPTEQTSETPTAKQCLLSLPSVCTKPRPPTPVSHGLWKMPLPTLLIQPNGFAPRESPQPSVWALDAGVLESRCPALQFWMLQLHMLCLSLSHELCAPRMRRVSCPLVLPQPPAFFSPHDYPKLSGFLPQSQSRPHYMSFSSDL